MHLFENCFRNCHTFYIMRPLQTNYKLFPYSFRDQYFRGITKMRKRRYVWRVSREYVRHGCLGWVAVCGLWDGGSERRWKWRLKPEASLKHCLLLLLGHLLLTHTSGISLQDLKKSKLIKDLDNKVIKDEKEKKDRKHLSPFSSIAIPPPLTPAAAHSHLRHQGISLQEIQVDQGLG